MKTFKVVLYINGETQWMTIEAKNAKEAKEIALKDIMVLSIEEIKN